MSVLINKDPMTAGKILDKSVNFVFKNILWITLIESLVLLPQLFFEVLLPSTETMGQFTIVKYKLALHLIGVIITPFLAGMITVLIGEHFCGRKVAWREGFKKSFKKWIPLCLLQVFLGIMIGMGIIALLIPGIIAMCATACAIPAMMLEDLGPMKAVDRSWELTKDNRFRIFAFFCLNMLVQGLVGGISAAITMNLSLNPLLEIGLVGLILAPTFALWPAMTTLIFYDLRIRKEAMDLEEEANTITVETERVA